MVMVSLWFFFWKFQKNPTLLLLFNIITLVVLLYGLPYFLEGTPRFRTGYWYLGQAQYILANFHLNNAVAPYHVWPGFFLQTTMFSEVTGLSLPTQIMPLFPVLISILYIFPLYVLYRKSDLSANQVMFATWFVLFSNWTEQTYYSAQALALVYFFLVLSMVLNKASFGRRDKVLYVLFFSALVMTHALTALVTLVIIMGLVMMKRLQNSILVMGISIFVAWTAFVVAPLFLAAISLPGFLNPAALLETNLIDRITGSAAHQFIVLTRISTTGLVVGIGFVGFLFALKTKLKPRDKSMLMIALVLLILLIVNVYSVETFERVYIFLLVPVSYFATKIFQTSRRIVIIGFIILLAASLPLNMIARYGSEQVDYVPPGELSASAFFYSHTSAGTILGVNPYPDRGPFGLSQQIESYNYFAVTDKSSELLASNYSMLHSRFHSPIYLFFPAEVYVDFTYALGNASIPSALWSSTQKSGGWDLILSNPNGYAYYSESSF
jgi:hypothetical protein